MPSPQVKAVVNGAGNIPNDEFTAYQGGWRNEIGTALVDAVYSIRAKYNAADPAKGVSGRVRRFREQYPEARSNLAVLAELGEEAIRDVMGNTQTGQRPKSVCVVEAAQALLQLTPEILTAEDAKAADPKDVKRAYTSVRGLGPITAEYFLMHLGVDGVKADRMIVRFVNRALVAEGLEKVTHWSEARDLIVKAYEIDPRGAANLRAFEHGIWRFESTRGVSEDEDETETD